LVPRYSSCFVQLHQQKKILLWSVWWLVQQLELESSLQEQSSFEQAVSLELVVALLVQHLQQFQSLAAAQWMMAELLPVVFLGLVGSAQHHQLFCLLGCLFEFFHLGLDLLCALWQNFYLRSSISAVLPLSFLEQLSPKV